MSNKKVAISAIKSVHSKITLLERDLHSSWERYSQQPIVPEPMNDKSMDKIMSLKGQIQSFKRLIAQKRMSPQSFLKTIQLATQDIQGDLLLINTQMTEQQEEMEMERKRLEHDIASIQERFLLLEQQKGQFITIQKTHATLKSQFPPEVQAFYSYIDKHGPTGGWDPVIHQSFVKLRQKYHGNAQFLPLLASKIPVMTMNEIEQHEQWYQTYEMLQSEHKVAIQSWKEQKQITEPPIEPMIVEKKENKMNQLFEKERKERRAKLQEWKEKKQQEQKRLQEEEELKKYFKQEIKNSQDTTEKKLAIQQYKEKKQLEKQLEQERIEKQFTKRRDGASMERIKAKEKEMLQKRKKIQEEKMRLEQEKEARLNRLKSTLRIHVQNDPERLFKPTKGYEQRLKDEFIGDVGPMSLFHVPRRFVPEWRQGL